MEKKKNTLSDKIYFTAKLGDSIPAGDVKRFIKKVLNNDLVSDRAREVIEEEAGGELL